MLRALVPLSVLALVLAGCVTPPDAVDAANAPKTAQEALPHLELSDAHDHKDRAQHAIAWNVALLGHDFVAPDGTSLGRYNHVSRHGDLAFVTAYRLEKDGAPGLAVFDVSGDDPVRLGTLETPDMTPIDVWPSPDGRFVFLAGHRDNRAALPGEAQACTGTPMVNVCTPFVPAGVVMVDVQDPAAPKVAATYASAPSGAHTVKAHDIGGDLYVFIASYGFATASRLASAVEIVRVDEGGPLGTQLVPVSRFFAERMSGEMGAERVFVHDMWVEEHPDGRTLMYVSYWDGGVVVADVGDPANPAQVAAWSDFDAATYGNVHFARPVGVIDGVHVTMAAPEFGSAEHAGEMYVLDTTDPAAPKLLAKWTLPGDPVNDGGYRFSPHNFDPSPDGTRVAYAHYHGGVWVLDLADPAMPIVKGYVFPTVPEGEAVETEEDAPNVWAAIWTERGTILASDIGTGLYHYGLVSQEPGVAPYEAFLG